MQLFPQGLTNILPPRAGSAHLDTVASLAAPAAVPAAKPPAMTKRSTSASQPHPPSTKRLMSAQQASSGCDCDDCDTATACSVAQSAVATVAPTREAAACSVLQAPEASVAAAWTQASEASTGGAASVVRPMRAARRTTRQREEDRVVVVIIDIVAVRREDLRLEVEEGVGGEFLFLLLFFWTAPVHVVFRKEEKIKPSKSTKNIISVPLPPASKQ